MGVSPVQRLVVPRVLATMGVAVLLNGLVSVVGILGGYAFNVFLQDGTPGAYLASFSALAQLPDLYVSELKALVFGFIAGVVAAYRGLNPRGGRRHHLPAPLLRQHGDDGRLPPARTAEGRLRSMASPLVWLDRSGDQLLFYVRSLLWIPRTLRRYLKEVQRLLAEVAFGTGGLGVVGGTIGVMIAMTLFTGTVVGLQGYAALDQIGTAAFTGFVSAYFNTREIAPLVAGLALSATVGAGFTAQLGAMRINEEVDALEGMGIRSLPYLVTTRIIAGVVAIIPLYAIGLLSSYLASRYVTVLFNGQSRGTYDHYFNLFLSPTDVVLSVLKVLIFSVMVIVAHCYYGYRASGGPAGVGVAVGRSVRNAIVLISVTDFFLSLALWGATTTVKVAG
jgi:phospholipid/cholesterol/gamma-HCH transport system permease protein